MSGRGAFEDKLTAWLAEGPDAAPGGLADAVLSGLPPVADRRFVTWRAGTTRRHVWLIAAVVAIAALTVAALSAGQQRAIDRLPTGSTSPTLLPTPSAAASRSSIEGSTLRGWIAFRNEPDIGPATVAAVNAADPTQREVLTAESDREPIGWSADGTRLLLAQRGGSVPDGFFSGLAVLNADGSIVDLINEQALSPSSYETGLQWVTFGSFSPDGQRVAFACCGSVPGPFVVDATGGTPHSLLPPCGLCGEPLAEAAAWSPDGTRIAWVDFHEDDPKYGHHASVLSLVRPDGTGLQEGVARLPREESWSLAWSPDGRQLAFWTRINDAGQIFVIDSDGSRLRQITTDGDNRWPTWSPDGKRIAYVHDGAVYTMAPDGTAAQRVAGIEAAGPIAWNATR